MRQKLCHFISVWCLSTLTEKKLLFEISNFISIFRRYVSWKVISDATYIGRAIATRDRLLSITRWNSISALMKLISLKICQDVNWMRVTFFLPPKSWAAGSVKKSDCDLWGPGLIDLDRLSVIKWSHQCQHWHSKRTRCQSNFLLLYTIGISWSTRILKD